MVGGGAWFAFLGMKTPSFHFKKHSIGSNTIPINVWMSMLSIPTHNFEIVNAHLLGKGILVNEG